jgi:Outer membrane protein beta-barrel domain
MKKTFLILLASGFGFYASAQSFDIGLKGGAASTWLMNTNVNNAGADEDIASTITYDIGLHLEYNFAGGCGLEIEVISEPFKQDYKGTFSNPPGLINNDGAYFAYIKGESYTATTQLEEIKVPLLFHYEAQGGFSLEVGPEFASISSATYTANYTNQPVGYPSSISYSTKSDFASSNLAAVLGFGWNIKLSGQIYMLVDLRFEYGLTDLIGTDGHGQDLNQSYKGSLGSLYASSQPVTGAYYYPSYTATHSLEGSLNIGLFYRIPMGSSGHSKM